MHNNLSQLLQPTPTLETACTGGRIEFMKLRKTLLQIRKCKFKPDWVPTLCQVGCSSHGKGARWLVYSEKCGNHKLHVIDREKGVIYCLVGVQIIFHCFAVSTFFFCLLWGKHCSSLSFTSKQYFSLTAVIMEKTIWNITYVNSKPDS